jgi:hypothetical protein
MNPAVEVLIELEGKPQVVGTLWTRRKQGRESTSFAYTSNGSSIPSALRWNRLSSWAQA